MATLSRVDVHCASNAEEAFRALENHHFELFVLNLNLADQKGFVLLSHLQNQPSTASLPCLCLSEKDEINEKVAAFRLGADDYIAIPFHPLELHARVDGKLEKTNRAKEMAAFRHVGPFEINHRQQRVSVVIGNEKKEIGLTLTEFKLFSCLALQPGRVYSRSELLKEAWGEKNNVLDRAVDVHLCALRKKLGPMGEFIRAISGVGYEFRAKESSDLKIRPQQSAS